MRKTYLRRIRKTEDQWCSNEQFIKKNYEKGNYNKKTTVDLSTPLNQQKKITIIYLKNKHFFNYIHEPPGWFFLKQYNMLIGTTTKCGNIMNSTKKSCPRCKPYLLVYN